MCPITPHLVLGMNEGDVSQAYKRKNATQIRLLKIKVGYDCSICSRVALRDR